MNALRFYFSLVFMVAMPVHAYAQQAYNPLAIAPHAAIQTLDLVVHDTARSRDIPVLVYLPATAAPEPLVLFSHGLGGSRKNNVYLAEHWAARGYVVAFLQHVGSDESLWKDRSKLRGLIAMKRAAGGENLTLRLQDVHSVLDQMSAWNNNPAHPLYGRVNMAHIGMSGHSFGAVTTQGVSGQNFPHYGTRYTDTRITAAVAFSPSSRSRMGEPEENFGKVNIPWMLMTGTNDVAPIGNITVEDRRVVYPALPPGGKYELVLDGAEHSAFGDGVGRSGSAPRNPNHHRVILALSTAFWDSWLKADAVAKAWLEGQGATSVLEAGDHWQWK